MKALTILVLLATCGLTACDEEKSGFTCNFYGLLSTTSTLEAIATKPQHQFSSTAEAISVVDSILDQVGLARNFAVMKSDEVDNAAAIVYQEKRYILYNQEFMQLADEISNNSWASISILAHEIGHHLQGHTLTQDGSRPPIELEADKFAGFVLARMGASLQDAQSAIMSLVSEQGSATHPKRSERLMAIAAGFKNGSNKKANKINGLVLQPKKGKSSSGIDASTRKSDPTGTSIYDKLTLSKKKTEPHNTAHLSPLDKRYVGHHTFTAQLIDKAPSGSANVKKGPLGYNIQAMQKNDQGNWVSINGIIFNTQMDKFSFNGTIKVYNPAAARAHNLLAAKGEELKDECSATGVFQFERGDAASSFWRMDDNSCTCLPLIGNIDLYFD